MLIEQRNPAELKPYWRNPRKIEAAVKAVKSSIEQFGFRQPVVVDKAGVIIIGHARTKAAVELGLTLVPVHVADDLDAQKVKALRIADNKSGELATWDNALLLPELRELTDLSGMEAFFPHTDLEELLRETSSGGATVDSGALQTAKGTSFEPPEQERIDQQAARMETQFEERSKEAKALLIELTCPCCGEDFKVSRDDVLKRPGVE